MSCVCVCGKMFTDTKERMKDWMSGTRKACFQVEVVGYAKTDPYLLLLTVPSTVPMLLLFCQQLALG